MDGSIAFRNNLYVGRYADGAGTVDVEGDGSLFSLGASIPHPQPGDISAIGHTIIGGQGAGEVNIKNGGVFLLDTDGSLTLGESEGGRGVVNIDGESSILRTVPSDFFSSQPIFGTMKVGDSGSGIINITNGGLGAINSPLELGSQKSGYGEINVSGASDSGIASNITGPLGTHTSSIIGVAGRGVVNVDNGGTGDFGILHLGLFAGSTGTLTATGANSLLHVVHELYVGVEGEGQTSIEDGASATLDSSVYVGQQAGSTGTLTVTGANSLLSSPNGYGLYVGDAGAGTLNVDNGGTATTKGDAYVGNTGTGRVSISGGGIFNVVNGSVRLGALAGSTGTLTVTGANSLLHGFHELYVGFEGEGQTSIEDGASATFDGSVHVG
ncbi:hypothetical protein, partial [Xanthomonas phaseoli]